MTQKLCYKGNFSKTLKNRRSGTDAQLRIELLLQHHSRRFFIPKPFCVRQDNSSTCTLRLTRPFASSHSVHDHGEKMDANRLAESARLELASPEGRLVSTEVSYQLELTLQRPRYLLKLDSNQYPPDLLRPLYQLSYIPEDGGDNVTLLEVSFSRSGGT